jgi:hypothetical protein
MCGLRWRLIVAVTLAVGAMFTVRSSTTNSKCERPAVDTDGNGFSDEYEQAIVNKFCPSLVLHSGDQGVSPEPVEIMGPLWIQALVVSTEWLYAGEMLTAQTEHNYSDIDSWYDFEHGVYFYGTTTCGYVPKFKSLWHFDYAGPGPDPHCNEWESHAYYDQPDGWYDAYHNGNAWVEPGANYPNTVYAHPSFRTTPQGDEYMIQYWLFYPFNDQVANHEGDWEHINVVITSDDPRVAEIESVIYYFHNSFKVCETTQAENPTEFDCYVTENTHPVVFVGGFSETHALGSTGSGPGSHASYPVFGHWDNVDNRDIDCGPISLPLSLNEVVDGAGQFIPWCDIVSETREGKYGVVLLKDPSFYDYDQNPEMSWHNANILWGYPFPHSFLTDSGLAGMLGECFNPNNPLGNMPPSGPAHQAGWEVVNWETGGLIRYDGSATEYPHASDAGWQPPSSSPGLSRHLIVSPAHGTTITGVTGIRGTSGCYDDSIVVDWQLTGSTQGWSVDGVEMLLCAAPFEEVVYAEFNTVMVPAETISIRARAFEDGIRVAEETVQVDVDHQCAVVALDGSGQFLSVQDGIDWASPGDTVYVIGPGEYQENVTLKEGVHVIARGFGTEIVGVGDNPTVSLVDNCSPCTLDGFVITHQEGALGYNSRGLYLHDAEIEVKNCTITGNTVLTAAYAGGGVKIDGETIAHFERCAITNNGALHSVSICGASAVDAGGTAGEYDPDPNYPFISFYDCDINGNTVNTSGISGGSALSFHDFGTDPVTGEPRIVFEKCRITANLVQNGVITFSGCEMPRLIDCVIADNVNPIYHLAHGAVYCHGSGLLMSRCTVANNRNLTGYRMSGVYTDGYPCPGGCDRDIENSIIAFNDGPAVGAGSWIDTISMTECDVYGNVNPSGTYGPTDTAWVSLGTNVVNSDPAFCSGATGDYSIYAFSPCAPGVTSDELIGARPVECVPDAVTQTIPFHLVGPDSIFTTCPQGDVEIFGVSVDFEDGVITREIGSSEIRLQPPACDSISFFANQGVVHATGPASPPGFETLISHGWIGGHGIDSVQVLLNGHAVGMNSSIHLRSVDYDGDGHVNAVDMSRLAFYYPSPPYPYNMWFDYDDNDQIGLVDLMFFSYHYGHNSPYEQRATSPPAGSQVDVDLRFIFTEEEEQPPTRRLYVEIVIEEDIPFSTLVMSLKNEHAALTFREWRPDTDYPGKILFTPTVRDGGNELFFGVLGAPGASAPLALGELVFDIRDGATLEVSEADFSLTVADLVTSEGAMASFGGASVVDRGSVSEQFKNKLAQNYPNPFNPSTAIEYSISGWGRVELSVFDVTGRLVRTLVEERKQAMNYRIFWDGKDNAGRTVASGVYFYRLKTPTFTSTRKMTLLH